MMSASTHLTWTAVTGPVSHPRPIVVVLGLTEANELVLAVGQQLKGPHEDFMTGVAFDEYCPADSHTSNYRLST